MGDPTFEIVLSEDPIEDLKALKKFERKLVLDELPQQLAWEPTKATRKRQPLRANDLSQWELRIGIYRVFSDVDGESSTVLIKSVGWKDHNILRIRGKDYPL